MGMKMTEKELALQSDQLREDIKALGLKHASSILRFKGNEFTEKQSLTLRHSLYRLMQGMGLREKNLRILRDCLQRAKIEGAQNLEQRLHAEDLARSAESYRPYLEKVRTIGEVRAATIEQLKDGLNNLSPIENLYHFFRYLQEQNITVAYSTLHRIRRGDNMWDHKNILSGEKVKEDGTVRPAQKGTSSIVSLEKASLLLEKLNECKAHYQLLEHQKTLNEKQKEAEYNQHVLTVASNTAENLRHYLYEVFEELPKENPDIHKISQAFVNIEGAGAWAISNIEMANRQWK